MEPVYHLRVAFLTDLKLQQNARGIEHDVLNRKDPIDAMIKLVDACSQTSRLFFIASPLTGDPAFHQIAVAVWRQLNQFEFELKTELRRHGGIDARGAAFKEIARDPKVIVSDCANSMKILVEGYEDALTSTLSAHARAMITRQLQEIQKHQEQLIALKIAA